MKVLEDLFPDIQCVPVLPLHLFIRRLSNHPIRSKSLSKDALSHSQSHIICSYSLTSRAVDIVLVRRICWKTERTRNVFKVASSSQFSLIANVVT